MDILFRVLRKVMWKKFHLISSWTNPQERGMGVRAWGERHGAGDDPADFAGRLRGV
jgi:hypothetical protein